MVFIGDYTANTTGALFPPLPTKHQVKSLVPAGTNQLMDEELHMDRGYYHRDDGGGD